MSYTLSPETHQHVTDEHDGDITWGGALGWVQKAAMCGDIDGFWADPMTYNYWKYATKRKTCGWKANHVVCCVVMDTGNPLDAREQWCATSSLLRLQTISSDVEHNTYVRSTINWEGSLCEQVCNVVMVSVESTAQKEGGRRKRTSERAWNRDLHSIAELQPRAIGPSCKSFVSHRLK